MALGKEANVKVWRCQKFDCCMAMEVQLVKM